LNAGNEAHEFGERRRGQDAGWGFCVLSQDGSLVATGGPDEPTKVWRVPRGELAADFSRSGDSGRLAAFSGDGKLLAVGGDEVTVYDVQAGREVSRLEGHKGVCSVAFSGDGRALASMAADGQIRLWELATGKARVRFLDGHEGDHLSDQWVGVVPIRCMTMSPNGSLLALAGFDATILLWDLAAIALKPGGHSPRLTEIELLGIWEDLAKGDPARAYQGMCRLMDSPAQAVPFLKGRLSPAPGIDPEKIARSIADLDNDEFAVREAASQRLAEFGDSAEPALRAFLKGKPSAESRKRAEAALDILAGPKGEALRAVRAIEVLEYVGPPAACRLLEELSRGAPEARLTREARASLDRIAKRRVGAAKPASQSGKP
jgi:hypothetical protein